MSQKGDLRFCPGGSGILFLYEPRRETQARREIERFLNSERFTNAEPNHMAMPQQLTLKSRSFLQDLEKEMGALSPGRSLSAPRGECFASCVSKVNGYLPYVLTSSMSNRLQVSAVLWKFFASDSADANQSTTPRYIHKALPFSYSCWSDVAYILKESIKVIEESLMVYKKLRIGLTNSSNENSKIRFAVQVTVRAHSSLKSQQSNIKCRFLSECWRVSDEFEYDTSILHSGVEAHPTKESPSSILYHITVLSQATFLGYILDAELSNAHRFRPKKIFGEDSREIFYTTQ